MKIFNNTVVALFLIACLLTSCKKFEKNMPAIEIGNISYSQEEYKVLINKYLKNKGVNPDKRASTELINNWQEDIINHSFLLDAAFESGVQNDKAVEEKVQKMSKQIILQKGGLLYQKSILPNIDITDKKFNEAIEHLDFEYQIECIVFVSEDAMKRVLTDDSIITYNKFQQLAELSKFNTDISYQKIKWSWIAGSFVSVRDQIYALSEGQVSLPIKITQGIVLFYVDKKNRIPDEYLKLYTYDKIHKILAQIEEQILAERLDMMFYDRSKLQIDPVVADKLWNILKDCNSPKIEEDIFADIFNDSIVTYTCDSGKIYLTIKEFIDYYNALMIKKTISNKQLLYYYLKEIPWEIQALKYAEELGLTKDKEFLTEQTYFRNRTIVDEFIRNKYKKQLHVSEEEVENEYNKEIQNYNMGEYAVVSLFYFNSRREAWNGYNELKNGNWLTIDSTLEQIQGLEKWQLHQKIHYENNVLNKNLSDKIFQIDAEEYIIPQKLASTYIIARKEGIEGERFIPLAEVSTYIKNRIFAKRYSNIKENLIDSLKTKNHIRINFPEV